MIATLIKPHMRLSKMRTVPSAPPLHTRFSSASTQRTLPRRVPSSSAMLFPPWRRSHTCT